MTAAPAIGAEPPRRSDPASVAGLLVSKVGGRFSRGLGIDVDTGGAEVDRWFLAATLFGAPIPARTAEAAFRQLDAAGLHTVAEAGCLGFEELVALLDAAGYARYDFRTARRIPLLATLVRSRCPAGLDAWGRAFPPREARRLEAELDTLPGWGPVTVRLFLRELRGHWRAARPALDPRTMDAAHHLHLGATLRGLARHAREAGLDARDLEAALLRVGLHHLRRDPACPGGPSCRLLAPGAAGSGRDGAVPG